MDIKILILLIMINFLPNPLFGLGLIDILENSVENSLKKSKEEFSLETQKLEVEKEKKLKDPRLDLTQRLGIQSYDYSIKTDALLDHTLAFIQPIYDPTQKINIELKVTEIENTKLDLEEKKQEMMWFLIKTYYNIADLNFKIKNLKNYFEKNNKYLIYAKKLVSLGESDVLALKNLEFESSSLEYKLFTYQESLEIEMSNLNKYLGLTYDLKSRFNQNTNYTKFNHTILDLESKLEDVKLESSYDLKRLENKISMKQKNLIKINSKGPKVDFKFNLAETSLPKIMTAGSTYIEIAWDLGNYFTENYENRKNLSEIKEFEAQKFTKTLELVNALEKLQIKYKNNFKKLKLLQKTSKSALDYMNKLDAKYTLQKTKSETLNSSLESYFETLNDLNKFNIQKELIYLEALHTLNLLTLENLKKDLKL